MAFGLSKLSVPQAAPPQPVQAYAQRDLPPDWTEDDERAFRAWYAEAEVPLGMSPDPDDPEHHYNYRMAWKAGERRDPASGHWSSRYKDANHPNRYVNGQDTITGESLIQNQIEERPLQISESANQNPLPVAASPADTIQRPRANPFAVGGAAAGPAGQTALGSGGWQAHAPQPLRPRSLADIASPDELQQMDLRDRARSGYTPPQAPLGPMGGRTDYAQGPARPGRPVAETFPQLQNIGPGQLMSAPASAVAAGVGAQLALPESASIEQRGLAFLGAGARELVNAPFTSMDQHHSLSGEAAKAGHPMSPGLGMVTDLLGDPLQYTPGFGLLHPQSVGELGVQAAKGLAKATRPAASAAQEAQFLARHLTPMAAGAVLDQDDPARGALAGFALGHGLHRLNQLGRVAAPEVLAAEAATAGRAGARVPPTVDMEAAGGGWRPRTQRQLPPSPGGTAAPDAAPMVHQTAPPRPPRTGFLLDDLERGAITDAEYDAIQGGQLAAPNDAVFKGWQEALPGEPPIALYDWPLANGTMTTGGITGLKQAGFAVPDTPPPSTNQWHIVNNLTPDQRHTLESYGPQSQAGFFEEDLYAPSTPPQVGATSDYASAQPPQAGSSRGSGGAALTKPPSERRGLERLNFLSERLLTDVVNPTNVQRVASLLKKYGTTSAEMELTGLDRFIGDRVQRFEDSKKAETALRAQLRASQPGEDASALRQQLREQEAETRAASAALTVQPEELHDIVRRGRSQLQETVYRGSDTKWANYSAENLVLPGKRQNDMEFLLRTPKTEAQQPSPITWGEMEPSPPNPGAVGIPPVVEGGKIVPSTRGDGYFTVKGKDAEGREYGAVVLDRRSAEAPEALEAAVATAREALDAAKARAEQPNAETNEVAVLPRVDVLAGMDSAEVARALHGYPEVARAVKKWREAQVRFDHTQVPALREIAADFERVMPQMGEMGIPPEVVADIQQGIATQSRIKPVNLIRSGTPAGPVSNSIKEWNEAIRKRDILSDTAVQVVGPDEHGTTVNVVAATPEEALKKYQDAMYERQKNRALADAQENDYRSPHWSEPNVVAHGRTNQRVVDGKNMLFDEEGQSDLHQSAAKVELDDDTLEPTAPPRGYNTPERATQLKELVDAEEAASVASYEGTKALRKEMMQAVEGDSEATIALIGNHDSMGVPRHEDFGGAVAAGTFIDLDRIVHGIETRGLVSPETAAGWRETIQGLRAKSTEAGELSDKATTVLALRALPDLPFKHTAEWLGLTTMRALAEAFDQGLDGYAWTTGAQQLARYNRALEGVQEFTRDYDGDISVNGNTLDDEQLKEARQLMKQRDPEEWRRFEAWRKGEVRNPEEAPWEYTERYPEDEKRYLVTDRAGKEHGAFESERAAEAHSDQLQKERQWTLREVDDDPSGAIGWRVFDHNGELVEPTYFGSEMEARGFINANGPHIGVEVESVPQEPIWRVYDRDNPRDYTEHDTEAAAERAVKKANKKWVNAGVDGAFKLKSPLTVKPGGFEAAYDQIRVNRLTKFGKPYGVKPEKKPLVKWEIVGSGPVDTERITELRKTLAQAAEAEHLAESDAYEIMEEFRHGQKWDIGMTQEQIAAFEAGDIAAKAAQGKYKLLKVTREQIAKEIAGLEKPWKVSSKTGFVGEPIKKFATQEEAEAFIREKNTAPGNEVWSFPFTKKMKDDVDANGLPLMADLLGTSALNFIKRFPTAALMSTGAAIGANEDEEHPWRGALVGALAGLATHGMFRNARAAQLWKSELGEVGARVGRSRSVPPPMPPQAAVEKPGVEAIMDDLLSRAHGSSEARPVQEFADLLAKPRVYESDLAELLKKPVSAKGDDIRLARGFTALTKYLTPVEADKVRGATSQALMDVFRELPDDADFMAAAQGGLAKKGWYEKSGKAIEAVWGADAPQFISLLAALSPRTSVESNLLNAVRMWHNWTAADRPTDKATILDLLRQSVRGVGKASSVLPSWRPNALRALQSMPMNAEEEQILTVLSGPKVDSFSRNIAGNFNELTNDAWMAIFSRMEQALLGGNINKAGTDPGKSPAYLALNIKQRRVAEALTQATGETWTPANVQETVWSWTKTLYEQSEKAKMSAEQFLREGRLTPALIAESPDFALLFTRDQQVRSALEAAGYGEALKGLDAEVGGTVGAGGTAPEGAAGPGQPGSGALAEAAPGGPGAGAEALDPALLSSAQRIDAVKADRAVESLAEAKAVRPERAGAKPGTGQPVTIDLGTGPVSFQNPLIVPYEGNPEKELDWRGVLQKAYRRKGDRLLTALAEDGFDGVLAQDANGTVAEVINLTTHPAARMQYTGTGGGTAYDVGVTSAKTDNPENRAAGVVRTNREVFTVDRPKFLQRLQETKGIKAIGVAPGRGGYEGAWEPTWVTSFSARDPRAMKATLAQAGKDFGGQDSVLILRHLPSDAVKYDPMHEIVFAKPVSKADQDAIGESLASVKFGGWTWGKRAGKTFLRVAYVPEWAFEGMTATKHSALLHRLSQRLSQVGHKNRSTVIKVKAEPLYKADYDKYIDEGKKGAQ